MWTENRFPLAGMENLFKNTLVLDEKTSYLAEISEKSKKTIGNSNDKSFE